MFQEHITVAAFSMGFVLSLGLMFAVGPQHLKLVKAGMSGSHVGTVATTGYLSEIIIVVLGLVLAGTAIADTPLVTELLRIAGIYFLLFCAFRVLMAQREGAQAVDADAPEQTRLQAIRGMLAITWLNPLSYAQVLFLVGALSTSLASDAQGWFAVGFVLASAIRFYGWGFIGRLLSQALVKPRRRQMFEIGSGAALILSAGVLAAPIFTSFSTF